MAFDSSHDDIMQVFDRLVRVSVMEAVDTLQSSQETKHLIVVLWATYFSAQLDLISGLAQKHGFLDVRLWILCLVHITAAIVQIPLFAEHLAWMMSFCLSLSGWKEWAWIISCSMIHAIVAFGKLEPEPG